MIAEIRSLFTRAEEHIKKVEVKSEGLAFTPVNELRYAGCHLLLASGSDDPTVRLEELQKAKNHCRRSIFDAVEIRMLDVLQTIANFEQDFRIVPLGSVLPNYLDLRRKYKAAHKALDETPRENKELYVENVEDNLTILEDVGEELENSRSEAAKVLSRYRWAAIGAITTLAVAILALPFFN